MWLSGHPFETKSGNDINMDEKYWELCRDLFGGIGNETTNISTGKLQSQRMKRKQKEIVEQAVACGAKNSARLCTMAFIRVHKGIVLGLRRRH